MECQNCGRKFPGDGHPCAGCGSYDILPVDEHRVRRGADDERKERRKK